MPPLRPLTRLSQLRELEVIEDAVFGNAGLELLPVTAFPAITRLTLCACSRLKVGNSLTVSLRLNYYLHRLGSPVVMGRPRCPSRIRQLLP